MDISAIAVAIETPPRPSAERITAGSGRASGLCESTRMTTPIAASTRPPGIGGSASLVGSARLGGEPSRLGGGVPSREASS